MCGSTLQRARFSAGVHTRLCKPAIINTFSLLAEKIQISMFFWPFSWSTGVIFLKKSAFFECNLSPEPCVTLAPAKSLLSTWSSNPVRIIQVEVGKVSSSRHLPLQLSRQYLTQRHYALAVIQAIRFKPQHPYLAL